MSSAKLQSKQSSGKATKEPEYFLGCKKCNLRFHHEGSIDKLLNVPEADCGVSCPDCVDQIAKLIGEGDFVEEYFTQAYTATNDLLHLDGHLKEYDACMKNDHQGVMQSLNSPGGNNSEKTPVSKDVESFWCADTQLMELRFQSEHFGSELHTGLQCVNEVQMEEKSVMDATNYNSGHGHLVNRLKAQCPSSLDGFSPQGLSQLLSDSGADTETLQPTESEGEGFGELSRSELLEALCHSQTRAREAEKLAQQACDEKEHVINLFFKQASYLFAYRQWLQILQLETLCLQFRNKDHGPSPFKVKRLRKGQGHRRPSPRRKQGIPRIKLNSCSLAFAVGFSLAGAGLLIGWTLGWLFPAF
nr:GH family 25 lysozyme 3 precursor [Ipomoea batatas]